MIFQPLEAEPLGVLRLQREAKGGVNECIRKHNNTIFRGRRLLG